MFGESRDQEELGRSQQQAESESTVFVEAEEEKRRKEGEEREERDSELMIAQKQCTEPTIHPKTCRYRSQRLLSASSSKASRSKVEE